MVIVLELPASGHGDHACPTESGHDRPGLVSDHLYHDARRWEQIQGDALNPYLDHTITQQVAMERTIAPIREFMMKQVREKIILICGNRQSAHSADSE